MTYGDSEAANLFVRVLRNLNFLGMSVSIYIYEKYLLFDCDAILPYKRRRTRKICERITQQIAVSHLTSRFQDASYYRDENLWFNRWFNS